MASALALRRESVWRAPARYPIVISSLSSRRVVSKHLRSFSSGKGPGDLDADKKDKNAFKKLTEVPLRFPPPASWGNQIQRRPRFGPKSQKFFQAATSPHKKYGLIRNLNLKLVKDKSNVPILIPGRFIKDKEEELPIHKNAAQDNQDGKTRRRRRKLPIVNAAAILDKNTYCKKSAFPGGVTTKSGHEAAKRLLRGKKDLVDMIRGTIVFQQSQRPFCLTGHGVPPQLLQDHIDMADAILQNFDEPTECQLTSNLGDSISSTDPSCPDSMTIRRQDGQTRVWAWPPQRLLQRSTKEENAEKLHDVSQNWDNSLVLYLAVMDRLSREMGTSTVGSYLHRESRKYWKVKMHRGMAYSDELISRPDDEEDGRPVPILEWNPLSSAKTTNNEHPHVSIRLQGTPQRTNNEAVNDESPVQNSVTLIYDAIFQEDPRVEPVGTVP